MELQCLLWLNSPIRERQSLLQLLQLLQVKPVTASVSTDSALCRLPCLFSSHWSFLFPSLSFMMVLMGSRQLTWHVVAATKSAGFRLPAFRSRLQTSLYQSAGLPVGLVPEVISPYMISLGIRPSCIRQTWPSQHRHLCESSACILNVFAWSSTSVFGTRSSQVMPRILLRQRRWKELSLRSCQMLRILAWYTFILVLVVSMLLFHTLLVRRAITINALPILVFSSLSRERLLEIVEP